MTQAGGPPVETLVTAETVAAAWHVSPESVYRWAREGKIERRILGDRTVRFPESVLSAPAPTVDPTDTAALRTLLARLLAERGIDDPGPTHRVQLYEADTGKWLMEVTAG
jgi:hypothetical protein